MEWRDVIPCSLALFFVIILDRVACSGSRKCQVRTAHNTEKHKLELDVNYVFYLIDIFRPCKKKTFLHRTAAYSIVYFSKTFKT
jgi:hypothetical protein